MPFGKIVKSIGGTVGGAVPTIGNVIRQANPFDPMSQLLGDKLDPNGANADDPAKLMPPPIDPRLGALRDQQLNQAKDFRAGLPQYQENQFNAAADASRRQLAGDISGVRKSANQRGMLYSGLRQGAEAAAGGNAAAALAKRRVAINQESGERADALDNQALQSGMAVQQLEQKRLDTAYERALDRQKQKQAGLGSIAGGFGGIMGGLGGK